MITGLAYAVVALAGGMVVWGLLTAALDKPPGKAQLLYAAAVEILTLVQSAIAGIATTGVHLTETATTIGYLIGIVVIIPVAWFWANVERTRTSGIVLAVAGVTVATM